VDETTRYIQQKGISHVGLLSTSITQKHNLYGDFFETSGIKYQYPVKEAQAAINEIIYKIVANTISAEDKKFILNVIENFAATGLEHIVLACTDLQLLKPAHTKLVFHDSMKILADAVFRKIYE
jgi:aspartate/glutamate racemase